MSASIFQTTKGKAFLGIGVLALLFASFPLVNYYFGNFYRGTFGDYKNWYPRFFFLVYPAVKSLPLLVIVIAAWLLKDAFMLTVKHTGNFTRKFFSFLNAEKAARKKSFADFVQAHTPAMKRFVMNLLLLFVSVALMLSLAEIILRMNGMKPGFRLSSQYFTPVDSLYELNAFTTDSNGIQSVSPEAQEFIRDELQTKNSPNELSALTKVQSTEVYSLPEDFLELRSPGYHSDFKTFLQTIESPADSTDAEFYNAIKEYVRCPINSNGFKSIAFKKYPSKRKSILLLGDSFTWGHSSSNKTNSFADLLLAKGYIVYNAGITGTDPAQYLQIAKVWIPRLQPDYVVVNFYMGNDIVYFERKPEAHVPVFYCTNAGNLISCPEGIYFYNPKEAYEHTLSVFAIPAQNNRFNRMCSKSVLGTFLWRILAKFRLVNALLPQYITYYEKVNALTLPTPYSDMQLQEIKKIAEQNGSRFLLLVIPSLDGKKFLFPTKEKPLFKGVPYFIPPVTLKNYHQKTDGHYNDSGHKMHAEFIDSLIKNSPVLP